MPHRIRARPPRDAIRRPRTLESADEVAVGGTAATNAGGAVTFKYGTTRAWVEAVTVVLANGDVLDLSREARAVALKTTSAGPTIAA